MEIHNQPIQGSQPARRPGLESIIDLTKPNRDGIHRAMEQIEAAREAERAKPKHQAPASDRADRIVLSHGARLLANAAERADGSANENAARVANLKARHRDGTLNTPERIAKTAERMLGAQ